MNPRDIAEERKKKKEKKKKERNSQSRCWVSSLHHELSPTCTLKWSGTSCLQITWTYQALISYMLGSTWYEGTAQLLGFTRVGNRIYFSFIISSLAETIKGWRRGVNWSNQRKPLTTLQKMLHTKPENSSPNGDWNLTPSCAGRYLLVKLSLCPGCGQERLFHSRLSCILR